jgi:hypothetical protein
MKRPTKAKSILPKAGAAIAATLAADAIAAERQINVPAVSMTRRRTAVIHMATPPDPFHEGAGTPPEPFQPECQATLTFLNQQGAQYKRRDGRAVERPVRLRAGQAQSLTLPASIVFSDGAGLRAMVRGQVKLGAPPEPVAPDPCAGAQVSVEIYDTATGRTRTVTIPPPDPFQPARQPGQ